MQTQSSAGDPVALEALVQNLIGIISLPGIGRGGDSQLVTSSVLDLLIEMLDLDFAYAGFQMRPGEPAVSMARVSRTLDSSLTSDHVIQSMTTAVHSSAFSASRLSLAGLEYSVANLPLGLHGQSGTILAGSTRAGFPLPVERVLLRLAANQVSVALQEALLLSDEKRRAAELEIQVAQRTSELRKEIEERIGIEAKLRETVAALDAAVEDNRRMIDAIPVAAWRTEPDGSIDGLNQEWLDYTGLTREQGAGSGWATAFDPDEAAMNHWARMRAEGKEGEVELRVRRHDGVWRRFVVRIRPYRNENGQIVKWYGTNIDIEDLKQAQDKLRPNEALLAQGQRVSATGNFLWRLESDEISFSDELYRIFGFELGEVISADRMVERVHPEDRPRFVDSIALARTGVTNDEYDIRLQMSDAAVKHIRASIHVRFDREGGTELVGVMQDTTARTLAEDALGKVRSELSEMTKVASLGALSASIAHEVSQPLAGIAINVNTGMRMLSADPPNLAGALGPLRRVVRDSDRACEVIIRLRAMFANKDPKFDVVNINEATREVLALSVGDLQRNQVLLRTDLGSRVPNVRGDRIQLQQVFLNLVLNAIDAMTDVVGRPKHLVVRTGLDGDANAYLSVTDVGVGFQPGDEEKFFKAFYTTKKTGMGIGLSVSSTIVQRHGGRIWATRNQDGPGATFSVSVPVPRSGVRLVH